MTSNQFDDYLQEGQSLVYEQRSNDSGDESQEMAIEEQETPTGSWRMPDFGEEASISSIKSEAIIRLPNIRNVIEN